MSKAKILETAARAAGRWPAALPGHVNFDRDNAIDVESHLEDGAHRLEGSPWQFVVENGAIVSAVREDLQHYRRPEETVHAPDETAPDPEPPAPDPDEDEARPPSKRKGK